MVEENPFIPIAWQKDHKGMQGNEYITKEEDIDYAIGTWLHARDSAIQEAKILNSSAVGVTKQLCNRLLEPFMWHEVILTATEFDNFFNLRCPKYTTHNNKEFKSKKDAIRSLGADPNHPKNKEALNDTLYWLEMNKGQAEIHMMQLAECMWDVMNEYTPQELKVGEWHIPYSTDPRNEDLTSQFLDLIRNEIVKDGFEAQLKIATARCARLSYQTLGNDSEINYEKDIKLHDNLLESKHMSPFEHCARVMDKTEYMYAVKGALKHQGCETEIYEDCFSEDLVVNKSIQGWCRNFRGFIQYRELVENDENEI